MVYVHCGKIIVPRQALLHHMHCTCGAALYIIYTVTASSVGASSLCQVGMGVQGVALSNTSHQHVTHST